MDRQDITRMQSILLEDLNYLSDICKNNGISFFLSSGTLLGAIRHNGFIPWDNDLDIMMTRENYEHFLTIANQVNNDRYKICTLKNDPSMPTIYAHMIDRKVIFCEEEKGNESDYLHIDIYACDYIKDSFFARTRFAEKLVRYYNRIFNYRRGFISIDTHGYWLKRIGISMGLTIFNHTSDERLALKIVDLVGSKERTDTMAPIASPYGYMKERFPSEYYQMLVMHKFENLEFPISKYYDEILRQLYGDYMTPPSRELQYKYLDKAVFRILG